jgi:hypothetical protein
VAAVLSLVPVLTYSSGLAALRSVRGGGLLSAGVEDMALGSLRGMSALYSRGAASVVSGTEGGVGSVTS